MSRSVQNHTARRGFTLAEMVTSCMIMSVLLVSLGYGLKLALVSTGNGAAQAVSSLDGADCVERVTDDLTEATNFTEKTSQAVTFTVPDRDGDGQPDKIRYAFWPTAGTYSVTSGGSGGSGGGGGLGGLLGGLLGAITGTSGSTTTTTYNIPANTLTKQLNDGVPSVQARDVRSFNLSYLYRTMNPPVATTTADSLLWSHDPLLGTSRDFAADNNKWVAETFLPSSQLPGGTVSWSITRIALYLKSDANYDSIVRISVRGVNSATNAPTAVIYDSALIPEISFNDSYQWVEFTFTNLKNLSPSTKYAVVIEGISGSGTYGTINYIQSTLGIPGIAANTWLVQTGNKGVSWAATTTSALHYRIYGTTSSGS